MNRKTLRPQLWKELPTLDSEILELLSRKTALYTGTDKTYKSLNGLLNLESNPAIIEEHLRNEARLLSSGMEGTVTSPTRSHRGLFQDVFERIEQEENEKLQTDKRVQWLNAAADYFARKAEEDPVMTIPEPDWDEQISKPEPVYTRPVMPDEPENIIPKISLFGKDKKAIEDGYVGPSINLIGNKVRRELGKEKWNRSAWNWFMGGVIALGSMITYSTFKNNQEHYVMIPEPVAQVQVVHKRSLLSDLEARIMNAKPLTLAELPFLNPAENLELEDISIADLPFITQEQEAQQTYTVQRGDNLNSIAGMFLSEEDNTPGNRHRAALAIAEYNNIEDPNRIMPGQEITISIGQILEYMNSRMQLPVQAPVAKEAAPATTPNGPAQREPIRADGPSEDLLAIGHDDSVCNDIFNYGFVNIPGIEGIVTHRLGVPGSEAVNDYWKENCSIEGTHYGDREHSTTNPVIVPIGVRDDSDMRMYHDDLEEKLNGLDDALIRDDDISLNTSDPIGYGKPGDFHIGSMMQLQYVMSKNPHSDYNEHLSAHNLAQMIGRGERISRAYDMRAEGMTSKEISEELGVSAGTARKYVAEAKRIAESKMHDSQMSENSEDAASEYKAA